MQSALAAFARIDAAVCVAGILRERMLFGMPEADWDSGIETRRDGTFPVFRAAAPISRK